MDQIYIIIYKNDWLLIIFNIDGKITLTLADQTVLTGIVKDESEGIGEGTIKYPDGNKYEGTWKNNLPSGRGVLNYPNEDVYVGDFLEGLFHGIYLFIYIFFRFWRI